MDTRMTRLGKPKDGDMPTRFLYVANCTINGPTGVGEDAIRRCFEQFGDVLTVDSRDDRGYLLLSFSSVDSAIHAKEHLHGVQLANRKLTIRFADELAEPSQLTRVACTSSTAQVVVPGLSLLENFLSPEEEQQLLQEIDAQPWLQVIQRRVQHYGYAFNYETRGVDLESPHGSMPSFCTTVIDKLLQLRPDLERPDQITVNEYLPGQGIAPHVDTPSAFGSYICSLSLNSSAVMDFRHETNPQLVKHVLLAKRSMCVMKNDSRYHWKHGIAYRKTDLVNGQVVPRTRRVSLTLRKVRRSAASDSGSEQEQDQLACEDESFAPSQVELEHVHKVYDEIAPHFSLTRHHPWPLVTDFLQRLEPGSLVADVGCGNGKYLGVNPSICIIGSDRSIPLLTCAVNKSFEVFGCDALSVPLATGSFDAAISIAVLHHMSTIEHRLQLIRELARVVRVGGRLFIVAWAFEQDGRSKRRFETQDVMVEWKLQDKYAATSSENDEAPGSTSNSVAAVTATNHAQRVAEKKWIVYQRYCHVYQEGELEQLVGQIPGLRVLKTEYSRSNWCIEVERY